MKCKLVPVAEPRRAFARFNRSILKCKSRFNPLSENWWVWFNRSILKCKLDNKGAVDTGILGLIEAYWNVNNSMSVKVLPGQGV